MDREIIGILGSKRWERIKNEAGPDAECIKDALLVLSKRFDIKNVELGYVDMDFVLNQKRLYLTLKTKV